MQKMFTKILLPVAFNRNTRWSVEKAVQLANKFSCDILLVHVHPPPSTIPFLYSAFFSKQLKQSHQKDLDKKILELEQQCKPKLKEGLIITSVVLAGYWQRVLKDVIITEHIDLALIPRSHRRFNSVILRSVNINKLAQLTNCPVMTITRNFNASHLHNIVVPVHDLLPVKKLAIATYLSIENSGCIYLMGNNEYPAKLEADYLLKAFRLLNDFGKLNIQCTLQDTEDAASGTLAYAKDIKANLIVINPGSESRLKGWWNKLRGKCLCKESDIPVITVGF